MKSPAWEASSLAKRRPDFLLLTFTVRPRVPPRSSWAVAASGWGSTWSQESRTRCACRSTRQELGLRWCIQRRELRGPDPSVVKRGRYKRRQILPSSSVIRRNSQGELSKDTSLPPALPYSRTSRCPGLRLLSPLIPHHVTSWSRFFRHSGKVFFMHCWVELEESAPVQLQSR